ncbi:DUF3914 domain-containing protein, partial [Bacillus anthracis]|nr:DUF3914 domain-containing protein [Bacillus anthracis]
LWIILEMLQKVRKEKESQTTTAIEETNETRLHEVM